MRTLVNFMTHLVQKYLPDPLIFAIILSIIVYIISLVTSSHTAIDILNMWGNGLWNLLGFTTQMSLVVVTGYALASAPIIKKQLTSLATLPKTSAQGVMLVTLVSSIACVLNWGFGLVIGTMFAREVAKNDSKSDYALLIACAYIGFITWHGGFSGSIPLLAATPGNPLEKAIGLIPLHQTLFSPMNIFITLTLIIVLPFITRQMLAVPELRKHVDFSNSSANETDFTKQLTPDSTVAEKLEESKLLALIVAAAGFIYLISYFLKHGPAVNINTVNLFFLSLGLILHRTPMAYMRAITAATKSVSGILIQFPIYAGIQAMMEHGGLGLMITNFFIHIANKNDFPLLVFFSSGIINFAIPSGGGHWVVQGPLVMSAAKAIGANNGKAVMAIAYGEEWMNMAQPFWAIPALAIAGLKARDIMGYCMIVLLFTSLIFIAGLTLF